MRVCAPSPHTSPGGNDGLHFKLASSAVNYFSRGGGGLPPGIYNAGSGQVGGGGRNGGGAGGDVVKGCYGNGFANLKPGGNSRSSGDNFFAAASEDRSPSTELAGDAIVVAPPDFLARASSQAQSAGGAPAYEPLNDAQPATTTAQNVAPGGINKVVELPMSGRGGTASPVLPGGRTFAIVAGGPGGGRGLSVVGLFLRSEKLDAELRSGPTPPFDLPLRRRHGRDASSSTASSALVIYDGEGERGAISLALSAPSAAAADAARRSAPSRRIPTTEKPRTTLRLMRAMPALP